MHRVRPVRPLRRAAPAGAAAARSPRQRTHRRSRPPPVHPVGRHQRHRGSAETAAGHPGAQAPRRRPPPPPRCPAPRRRPRSRRAGTRERPGRVGPGRSSRRPGRPARHRPTRSISVTTWWARRRRRRVGDPGQVVEARLPQGRHTQLPRGRLAVRATRAVATVGQLVGDAGVGHQECQVARGPARTCRSVWSPKSISSAEPGSASIATIWSIPPVGAPGHLRLGAHAGPGQVTAYAGGEVEAGQRRPAPRPSRTRCAAELDSPAPSGTVLSTAMSTPGHLVPVLAHRPDHARRRTPPTRRPARAGLVEAARPDVVGLPARDAYAVVVAPGDRGVGRVRQGDRQARAAVVVGVLADQVHPPRCPADGVGVGAEAVGERGPDPGSEVCRVPGLDEGHGPTLGR